MLPGRPVRHQVGVGDQHARRVGMGAEDADRLARLHQQRLVRLEPRAAPRRCGRSSPSRAPPGRCRRRRPARRAARRPRDRGCSSACAAAPRSASSWPRASRAARRADDAGVVDAGHRPPMSLTPLRLTVDYAQSAALRNARQASSTRERCARVAMRGGQFVRAGPIGSSKIAAAWRAPSGSRARRPRVGRSAG